MSPNSSTCNDTVHDEPYTAVCVLRRDVANWLLHLDSFSDGDANGWTMVFSISFRQDARKGTPRQLPVQGWLEVRPKPVRPRAPDANASAYPAVRTHTRSVSLESHTSPRIYLSDLSQDRISVRKTA